MGGSAHAEGDRFAVQQQTVLGFGFERMADGVPKVQNASQVALFFVRGDHFAFDAHTLGNGLIKIERFAGQHSEGMIGHETEEFRAANDAVFEHFVEARADFAHGQRIEHLGIDDDGQGLVKGPDEVLAADEVDARFAADGGVHLGQ